MKDRLTAGCGKTEVCVRIADDVYVCATGGRFAVGDRRPRVQHEIRWIRSHLASAASRMTLLTCFIVSGELTEMIASRR